MKSIEEKNKELGGIVFQYCIACRKMRFFKQILKPNKREVPKGIMVIQETEWVCEECNESSESLLNAVEKILKPKYMNTVFTWAQIKKAIKKVINS